MTSVSFPRLNIFSHEDKPSKDEMLGLYLSMLYVRMRSIESRIRSTEASAGQDAAPAGQAVGGAGQGAPPTGQQDFSRKILEEIRVGIKEIQTTTIGAHDQWDASAWTEAYRMERLLALVEPPETLTLDLDRRLNEAIANKLPSVERLRLDANAAKNEAFDDFEASSPEAGRGRKTKERLDQCVGGNTLG